jgi:hypothetical protein
MPLQGLNYPRSMSPPNNPNPGDFDARLQFLLQSSESLHANLQELHSIVEANYEKHEIRLREIDTRTDRILTGIESLLAIAKSHQDRLDKLEGGSKQ